MNRSLLLIICDFLLLSLLALARFDAPVTEDNTPESEEGEAVSPEIELVEILKLSLDSEREAQQELNAELEKATASIENKENELAQTNQKLDTTLDKLNSERAHKQDLLEQSVLLQQEKGDMAESLLSLREQNILERERLRQAQEQIEKQQESIEQTLETVTQISQEKAELEKAKQMVETELVRAETQNVFVTQQLENSRLEIEIERKQRQEAEQRTESLSEGVKVLAGTSVEIKEEIKQLQPKTPNALYTEYKRNRIKIRFDTTYQGTFRQRTKTYELDTILVTDSKQTYAIVHTKDTPFDLSALPRVFDGVDMSVTIGEQIYLPEKVQFHRIDPRILLIPVAHEAVDEETYKVYPIVFEPFRFPKAVVIDNGKNFFGESSFKVHTEFPNALQMDKKIMSQFLGEFSPSKGDLVIAQTGEFMGVMINNEYAGLIDFIDYSDTIWVNDGFDSERSNTIITKLSNLVIRSR